MLRQGLARSHVGPVVAVCAVSDVVLIIAGIAGIGTIVERAPAALDVVRWFGVAFLVWYGVRSLWRARRTGGLRATGADGPSRRSVVLTATALTWLNPHVYLDTVLLLGSIANQHGNARWWFGLGASLGSALWFTGLGFGARRAQPWLRSARAWQVLDILIGATMLALAAGLAAG